MKLSKVRLYVFLGWLLSAIGTFGLLLCAPYFRKGIIAPDDANAAIFKVLALYVPVITAYGMFWYGPKKNAATDEANVDISEKWQPIIALTFSYFLIVTVKLVLVTYIDSYASDDRNNQMPAKSFNDQISDTIQLGLYLSPLATIPAAFLIGGEKVELPKN